MAKTLLGCSEAVYAWTLPKDGGEKDVASAPTWQAKQSAAVVRQFEVVWAPQLVTFASAGEDGRITFNRPNGEYLGSLSSVSTATHSIDFHPKSRILVSGGEDSVVRVWDLKDKKVAMTWKSHSTSVTSVRCSPDEDHVATSSVDGIIFVHNLRNGKTVTKLQVRGKEEGQDPIKMIQYSPFERSRIAACTDKGKVILWESSRAKLMASIAAHVAPTSAISFSRVNAALIISASLDKTAKLHDIRARKTVSTLQTENLPATALDIASDGNTLAIGTATGQVLVYDLRKDAKPLYKLSTPNSNQEIESLTFQHYAEPTTKPSKPTTSASSSSIPKSTTDNYFAPSPQTATVANPVTASSSSSSLPVQTEPMELFSPLRSFEPPVGSTSTPNLHAVGPLQAPSFDLPLSASTPMLNLGSVLSPLQSSHASSSHQLNIEPLELGTAPSGTPLSLLSPAPPTPSSYRYTSRLPSSLYSPRAGASNEVTSTTGETPRRVSSFSLSEGLAPIPLSPVAGDSFSVTPRMSLLDSPLSSMSRLSSASFLPNASPLQPLGSSTPVVSIGTPTSSSTVPPLDLRVPRSMPGSPTAPKQQQQQVPPSDHAAADHTHEGIQWQLVQSVLGDMMDGFRSEVQMQMQSMHMEMIRQFHIQQTEIASMLQQYDTNKQLLDIIKELREENERLRKLY